MSIMRLIWEGGVSKLSQCSVVFPLIRICLFNVYWCVNHCLSTSHETPYLDVSVTMLITTQTISGFVDKTNARRICIDLFTVYFTTPKAFSLNICYPCSHVFSNQIFHVPISKINFLTQLVSPTLLPL